jgi:gamma-glutamylputrescine oxidase
MNEQVASYYQATARDAIEYPALVGYQRCDVCVVGGGLTGLSAALHLAERGYQVVLLERRRIAWGASGRNGGQLHSGQRRDQRYLEKHFGNELAKTLWDLAEEAKSEVRERIARHAIDCELTPGVLHAAHKPRAAAWWWDYCDWLSAHYDYPQLQPVSEAALRDMLQTHCYFGGALDRGAAHLHPLNYALGLAGAAHTAGAQLFERSGVLRIGKGSPVALETEHGRVEADRVVMACNAYLRGLVPAIDRYLMPINNYVLATESLGETRARRLIRDNVAVADSRFVVNYFRLSADHRLLFGGGESYSRRFATDIAGFVRKFMLEVFPQLADTRIDFAWGGMLGITMNRLPSFGRLENDIYFAQGFSGQGLALTTLAGKLIAEAIGGTAERFDVFAGLPARPFPGGPRWRWPLLVLGMLYYRLRDRL